VWNIESDVLPVDELQDLAELLSAQRLDASGVLTTLDRDAIQLLWTRLHAKVPAQFSVTPEEVQGWHQHVASGL
jgi:hypothetical protein